MHGNLRWAIPTHRSELYPHSGAFNSPDISNGVVYVAYDRGISAIDGDSAAVLWRYQTQADIFSRASIVQGGLFVGDLVDRLYCFTVNGA
jgi:outer membrane protein assembly factor BamB